MRPWTDKVIDDLARGPRRHHWFGGGFPPILLVNGCFDLLHIGHVTSFYQAKSLFPDHVLVVGINSDASIRQLKGPARPIIPEIQRLLLVAALEAVDYCFLFHETRFDAALRLVRPAVWLKTGYTLETVDHTEREAALEVGTYVKLLPASLTPASTSAIIEKIQNARPAGGLDPAHQ